MEYLGAWGTLIHEKNLKSKISCQTPFTGTVPYYYSCENGQVMENTKHRQFIYRPDGKLLRYVAR
jgi:hypothetical protein